MPGSGDTQLFSAIFRRQFGALMETFHGRPGAVKLRLYAERLPFSHTALYPDFTDIIFLPIRKEADTVTARHNGFEIPFQFAKGQVFIYDLPNLKARLYIERYLGYDTEPAQPYHGAQKLVAILFSRKSSDFPGCVDELYAGNGGRQIPILYA